MTRLPLQGLATLAHRLKGNDPTLTVTAINLNAARDGDPAFDVEIAASFKPFAPKARSRRLQRSIVR